MAVIVRAMAQGLATKHAVKRVTHRVSLNLLASQQRYALREKVADQGQPDCATNIVVWTAARYSSSPSSSLIAAGRMASRVTSVSRSSCAFSSSKFMRSSLATSISPMASDNSAIVP